MWAKKNYMPEEKDHEQLTIEQLIEQQATMYAIKKCSTIRSMTWINYHDAYSDGLTEVAINNPDQFGLFTLTEIKEYEKQIETLNAIVEMKEQQRKGWADMCIKKEGEIQRLEKALLEVNQIVYELQNIF